MLERIEEIQGIGLFHEVNGKPFKLQKATVIYGDNGRGKSTLATILRSVGANDPMPVIDRKTIDGKLPAKVALQFSNGQKVSFSGDKWSQARPEFLVFDADFVEKNVHSGGSVNTGHRKNLLQFALGEKAVAARLAEEAATGKAKDAADAVQKLVGQLSGHHEGIALADFDRIESVADADQQIETLEKRVVAARNSESLLKRPVPGPAVLPSVDLKPFFGVLATTMESVQEDAEHTVRAHVTKLGKPGVEPWLSQGLGLSKEGECPYCAQSTVGLGLVQAYKTHFNAAYSALKAKVSHLERDVLKALGDSVVTDFAQRVASAAAVAASWNDHVVTPTVLFDEGLALSKLREARDIVLALVSKKQLSPTEAAGTDGEAERVEALLGEVLLLMEAANKGIGEAKGVVDEFRRKLEAEGVPQLLAQQKKLGYAKRRHSPTVVALLAQLAVARAGAASAEAAKSKARGTLDALMKQTLKDYENTINQLLKKFGASFLIESMDANFRGGAPRSEYGLALRGKSVPLEGGAPSFGTVLSEGDKRTLAFAFFVASALSDPKLNTRVIVVDDPMCSLDLNRKQHTRRVLKELCEKATQVIVLAHDVYFAKDLRDEFLPKDKSPHQVAVLCIRHAAGSYSTFDAFDVDRECQSPYFQHHELLKEYVANGAGDHRHVAKAIRLLLEGYLHRRFPGLIPTGLMFGNVVSLIKDADPSSPLYHARSAVGELGEINDYAGQFHHDTNPGNADSVLINPTELHTFAKRCLAVVYKGSA